MTTIAAKMPELTKEQQIAKLKSSAEKRFEAVKAQGIKLAERCNAIIINDEDSLSRANQVLSEANDLVKAVEKKRLELVAPATITAKIINATAKDVSDEIKKSLEVGKVALRGWNEKVKAKEALENAENQKKFDFLQSLSHQIQSKIELCLTPENCQNLINNINLKWPAVEKFGIYNKEAEETKSTLVAALDLRKKAIVSQDTATLSKSVATIASVESIKEVAQEKKVFAAEFRVKTSAVRNTWKFKIIDEAKLPLQFLSPDSVKIRTYMDANKDKLNPDGEIKGGVKFYRDAAPQIK